MTTNCLSEWDDDSEEEYEDQERIRALRLLIEEAQTQLLAIAKSGTVQYSMSAGDHSQSATRQRPETLNKLIQDSRNEIRAIRSKYRGSLAVGLPTI